MDVTKGTVTSVSWFSETDDQITIQILVPEPLGEEEEVRKSDLIVPKGSLKVGHTVNILVSAS